MSVAEQATAFWGAVAQIVPVLALAITLESRILARKFGRKKSTVSRRSQAWITVWMLLTWLTLICTFGAALGALSPPIQADWAESLASSLPREALFGLNSGTILAACISLLNGVAFAAYVPGMRVLEPGFRIIRNALRARVPWSTLKSIDRDITRTQERNDRDYRKFRNLRLASMMNASESLVLEGEIERATREVRSRLDEAPTLEDRRQAVGWLSEQDRNIRTLRDHYETVLSTTIRELDEMLHAIDESKQANEGFRERLNALRDSTDPDLQKELRKLYLEAGRE